MRTWRCGCDLVDNGRIVGVLILGCLIIGVSSSIHEYKNEAFIPRFNFFFFYGGSEGLYASRVHDTTANFSSQDKLLNEKSFIG